MPRPTISDVAMRCGVTKATVSKALSTRPGVCDLAAATRQRIIKVAAEMGYSPAARVRQRFGRVGLLYGTRVPIFLTLFEGFADALGETFANHGFDLIFIPAVAGIQDWERAARDLRLDGLVVTDPVPPHLTQLLAMVTLPVVLVNHHIDLPVARLVPDEAAGMRLLVDHLAELGHRRICYYQSEHFSGHPSLIDRLQGYHLAMAARGLAAEVVCLPPAQAAARFAAAVTDPATTSTAIIAYNCGDGVDLAELLLAGGVRLPHHLSLACFDDIDRTRRLDLTVVHIPRDQMGRRAAELLVEQIAGQTSATHEERMPVSLIVRSSTAAPN